MAHKLTRIVFVIFLFIMSIFSVYSSVEVFSEYKTILKVNNDNTIEINKTLKLKNVYDVGIVPGQIEFKVGKGIDGSVGNIEVKNVKAVDRFGNVIKSQVRNTNEYSIIILDVYYPLLPGFEYEFNLFYSMAYEPGGIFFKSLQIPIRESTIPIEKGEFQVILPENYHFTYLGAENSEAKIEENVASWSIKDNMPNSVTFEYSYLPIKIGNMKGSYIFWILINVILLLILIFEIRKEIKRVRAEYVDGNKE